MKTQHFTGTGPSLYLLNKFMLTVLKWLIDYVFFSLSEEYNNITLTGHSFLKNILAILKMEAEKGGRQEFYTS